VQRAEVVLVVKAGLQFGAEAGRLLLVLVLLLVIRRWAVDCGRGG
jgi:hypothetical protein